MSAITEQVELAVRLPRPQLDRLHSLSQTQQVSEDELVARALEVLFAVADLFDGHSVEHDWSVLSEAALARMWENEKDAIYDNWRELCQLLPARSQ